MSSRFDDISPRRHLLLAALMGNVRPGPYMANPLKVGVLPVDNLVKPEKVSRQSFGVALKYIFTSEVAFKFSEMLVVNGVTEQDLMDILAGKARIIVIPMGDEIQA
ncbi:MAG: hypothetical protein AUJ23_00140 [Candidatus Magasanikbacteria bacterium CG1_02_32_51]|uniref:Uncharacterized protein n=1 Tax=Candidatus Magasanikbacteria bacterium CG1_02_32_51 TaxID=1805238 RepID=A0A1J4UB37_9BACT|nr:MAG: hypothetical protein AUJ23_00140 [Candidatus Magasanikbacteria bacterium CG1_02_32_51]